MKGRASGEYLLPRAGTVDEKGAVEPVRLPDPPDRHRAMMGMSAPEWSRYLHDEAGVPDDPDAINRDVVERMLEAYRRELPLLPGAQVAVRRTAAAFRLGLASSSNREVFEAVL